MGARERGEEAERRVHDYLVGRGLEPLGRNWRRRLGELDLILRERTATGDVIVFVEVRYRHHPDLGGGLASVDAHKRARLRRAARAWLQRHADPDQAARIDVIAVGPAARRPPADVGHPGEPGSGSPRRAGQGPVDGDEGLRAGRLARLGEDDDGRPLMLEWVVNAVEEDG